MQVGWFLSSVESQANRFPPLPLFMLSYAKLAPYLTYKRKRGVNLLFWRSARNQASLFPEMSNYSFKSLKKKKHYEKVIGMLLTLHEIK